MGRASTSMCWWLAYAWAQFVLMVLTEAREWTRAEARRIA